MLLIAHRGNIEGPDPNAENSPIQINIAIAEDFDVHIDVWVIDGVFHFGHDKPQYEIGKTLTSKHLQRGWFHCKNAAALTTFRQMSWSYAPNYFWHQNDDYTLTSQGYIWVHPGKPLMKKGIAVSPEQFEYNKADLSRCAGICSDYIRKYSDDNPMQSYRK